MGQSSSTIPQKPAKVQEDLDEDPVESMLNKTGCLEKHYAVQECIAESKDWRKCQDVVKDFRACIEKHQKEKEKA